MPENGYSGVSLAGRWECGNCGASGDGWWDEEKGLTLDVDFTEGPHTCPGVDRD